MLPWDTHASRRGAHLFNTHTPTLECMYYENLTRAPRSNTLARTHSLEHTRSNTGTNGRSNKLLVWINSRVTIRRKDISTRSGIWMKSLRSLERRNQQEVILFECIKREWLRTFQYWVRLNFNSITCYRSFSNINTRTQVWSTSFWHSKEIVVRRWLKISRRNQRLSWERQCDFLRRT